MPPPAVDPRTPSLSVNGARSSAAAGSQTNGAAGAPAQQANGALGPSLVVRLVVPTRKSSGGDMSPVADTLLDPEAGPDDVIKALKRTALLAKNQKFLAGAAKSATPVVKSVLNVLKLRAQDDAMQLAVLETLAALCKAVKAISIIVRLEGGIPAIVGLVLCNVRQPSYQLFGFSCLAGIVASPQSAAAVVKAGALQAVLSVLNEKTPDDAPEGDSAQAHSLASAEGAVQALNVLTALAKSTDGSLAGTLPVMLAVVNAVYARIRSPSVVSAATDFLAVMVRRPAVSDEAAEALAAKHIDLVRRVGGVDAMFVIVGRYSEHFDVFRGAYAVLNRLLRRGLTAGQLGEYPDARGFLDPERRRRAGAEGGDEAIPAHLAFPESDDNPLAGRSYLDPEHAAARGRGRALPPAVSGVRAMLWEGGVSAARARAAGANGSRHPFLPPGPEVLAEVMLLNVARWMRTSQVLERDVYVAFAPEPGGGGKQGLFDRARATVWAEGGGAEVGEVVTCAEALVGGVLDEGVGAGGRGEEEAAGDATPTAWPGGPARVSRSVRSARQRDSVGDASDGDEELREEAEEEEGAVLEEGEDEDEDGADCAELEDAVRLIDSGLALGGGGGDAAGAAGGGGSGGGAGEGVGGEGKALVTEELNRNTLLFESRFEGGNLGRAVQVHEFEYDLYLMPDINTKAGASGGNTQWYYFAVTNMRSDVEYKLNILNFVKPDSLYNIGMRPAFYSAIEAASGRGWQRAGQRIAYYENQLETDMGQPYYTLTFTITFPHAKDVCYLAHCFPYTYTDLSNCLTELLGRAQAHKVVQMSTLCTTLVGNKCPLLTITNFATPPAAIASRRAICVSARVHPGETCASWAMQGFLEFICGASARARILRDNFVFKVVPMLNPDGVVNGNYRCSVSGHDLNRQWSSPDRYLHPTVHGIKQMLRTTKGLRDVSIFCDIHGHSRKCNMFMYGCSSKAPGARLRERVFPYLLHNDSLMFSYDDCNFKVQRCKESAARVVVWRELAISNSYTLEMSLGGGDFGEDAAVRPPLHFSTDDYLEMGKLFCEALLDMYDPGRVRLEAAMHELDLLHPEIKKSAEEEDADVDADGSRKPKLRREGSSKGMAKKPGAKPPLKSAGSGKTSSAGTKGKCKQTEGLKRQGSVKK